MCSSLGLDFVFISMFLSVSNLFLGFTLLLFRAFVAERSTIAFHSFDRGFRERRQFWEGLSRFSCSKSSTNPTLTLFFVSFVRYSPSLSGCMRICEYTWEWVSFFCFSFLKPLCICFLFLKTTQRICSSYLEVSTFNFWVFLSSVNLQAIDNQEINNLYSLFSYFFSVIFSLLVKMVTI